mmetsp:Transcript_27788/g.49642  ORF Transcript_27788/g.49642 Transcript_27788/m.49642 type:complete len:264 (-) Transcript_27788:202-993(-)
MASFQLNTGMIFIPSSRSTVCLMPFLKSSPRKSLRVTSSWEQERSMWLKRRSYRLIRPLCPEAAAARISDPVGSAPDSTLSSFKLCSCKGVLFRICSRLTRCTPEQTAPEVTRMISRPLLTNPSSCSIKLPILPSASRPSQLRETTCLPTLTIILRAFVSFIRSDRVSAASERGDTWPEEAGVVARLLLEPCPIAPRCTLDRLFVSFGACPSPFECFAPPMCTSVSAFGTKCTCASIFRHPPPKFCLRWKAGDPVGRYRKGEW